MAFVTLEDYNGNKVDVNPDLVSTITTYQHFEQDKELPEEMMILNPSGLPEVAAKHLEAANALRTSTRTMLTMITGIGHVVTGTPDEVKKALAKAK